MNCLRCGKPLRAEDEKNGWHKSCIRRFFGTGRIPEIRIDDRALEQLALENTSKGLTVPGVQKKLSLTLTSDGRNPRLTLGNYPTGYILKPQDERFTALPEAEHLVMSMAEASGIAVVPHALLALDTGYAYITKRIDRIFEKDTVRMLAMEDFCQLDLRLTQDKYRGSCERCAGIINRYSSRTGIDRSELFMRLVFCFLTGNSDMHLKNFSLIETFEGSGMYCLSPAYDLLPVNIVMPEDPEQFALTLNGKKRKLVRKDFLIFAESCGIARNSAERMIAKLTSLLPEYERMCGESLLPEEMKTLLNTLMETRCKVLTD